MRRIEFGHNMETQRQLDIVLDRFMCGEHLSSLSCLPDGVSPTSFNRLYKWLKDGKYTNGIQYAFKEYWSEENENGVRKKGAYKVRVLVGKIVDGKVEPIEQLSLQI